MGKIKILCRKFLCFLKKEWLFSLSIYSLKRVIFMYIVIVERAGSTGLVGSIFIYCFNFRRLFPSPLKRLQAAGSFDEQIKNILKKDNRAPLIKFVLLLSFFSFID